MHEAIADAAETALSDYLIEEETIGMWNVTPAAYRVATAVQAELVRASTVTTEAELRELAVGTIIMDGDQDIYCRDDHGWYIWGAHDGETVPFLLLAGYLPARVLHRPV